MAYNNISRLIQTYQLYGQQEIFITPHSIPRWQVQRPIQVILTLGITISHQIWHLGSSRNHNSLATAFINCCHLFVQTSTYFATEEIPSYCLLLNLNCLKPVGLGLIVPALVIFSSACVALKSGAIHMSLKQCFPTFFQPRHTFLEPITRRHTAFMTPNLYTRLAYDV